MLPTEAELNARIQALEKELGSRDQRLNELESARKKLQDDLARLTAERPRFQVESFAQSFKTLLETVQAQAATPTPSGLAGALRSIDIEVKGFVEVQQGKAHLIVPRAGEAVDSNALSLLRLSFVAVPTPPAPPK